MIFTNKYFIMVEDLTHIDKPIRMIMFEDKKHYLTFYKIYEENENWKILDSFENIEFVRDKEVSRWT